MDVKELAANMSETGNFLDTAASIKLFKPLTQSVSQEMKGPCRIGCSIA